MAEADGYRVVNQMYQNRYDPNTNTVQAGWWISYTDADTGTLGRIFVPEANYPDGARPLILQQLAAVRKVHRGD